MSSPKEAVVGVFSRAAATYNSVGPRHFTYFARRLVEYVDVRPGDRVLDVATGTGEVLLAAAERSGENGQVVGWYFQHDSRWHWQEDVLRSFGALHDGNPADSQPTDLPTALTSVGFTAVQPTEDAFDLVFRDEEEWWHWSWSHGTRRLFEAVPPTRLDELKQRLFLGLHGCREDDGMIHGTMRATLMLAHKPQRR